MRIPVKSILSVAFAFWIQCALAQQYVISTVAGGVPPSTPAPAIATSLNATLGVAADGSGNVFFSSDNSIFKIDKNGILTRIAGNGRAGYSGDGGRASDAQLSAPCALVMDTSGNLYFADGSYRIRKIGAGGTISTIAGNGTKGYLGDGQAATSAELSSVLGLALDAAGNLYLADTGNYRIREVTPSGVITTFAGGGKSTGDGVQATSAALAWPMGVAVDSAGNVLIADQAALSIRKVATNGVISTLVAPGAYPPGGPTAVAADASGAVYIVDGVRLFKVQPDGTIVTVASQLPGVESSIALDPNGNILVADNSDCRILSIVQGGSNSPATITTIAGNGAIGYSGDGGPATSTRIGNVKGIATDGSGNIYFADSNNHRVRMVSASGVIATIAGNGVAGFSGDGGPAALAQLKSPVDVAIDASGNIYIADFGNFRVRKISANGVITTVAGNGATNYAPTGPKALDYSFGPQGLAVDTQGSIYISDGLTGHVCKVTSDGSITVVAAMTSPLGLAVDQSGALYVASGVDARVFKVAGGNMTLAAGTAKAGYSGDGGPAASAQLKYPTGVAVDAAGNLYIADSYNNRIRKVSADGTITTIAGSGPSGYTGDGGPATAAQLFWPWGVSAAANGAVVFTDNNTAIRMLQPAVSGSVVITTAPALPSATSGSSYSQQLLAAGGSPPYRWSLAGSMPAGLSLSAAGIISGTPSAAGSATFTVSATDTANASASQKSLITVNPQPTITAGMIASGMVGVNYAQVLTVSGGTSPYVWRLVSGSLPPTLSLNGSGMIAGTPSSAGTYTFGVQVSDSTGSAATDSVTVLVQQAASGIGSPVIAAGGIVSAAGSQKSLRPGSWATIYGSNLSATTRDWGAGDFSGNNFPTVMDGVAVSFNGKAAFIRSVSPGQVNVQVPNLAASDYSTGTTPVTLSNSFATSPTVSVAIADHAPGFFVGVTANSRNYVAATETAPSGTIYIGPSGVTGVRPAKAGETITLWGTGFGPTVSAIPAGAVFNGSTPTSDAVQILIDNAPVSLQYSGLSGAGLYQFNLTVPNLPAGDHTVSATIAGVTTPGTVWLATQ